MLWMLQVQPVATCWGSYREAISSLMGRNWKGSLRLLEVTGATEWCRELMSNTHTQTQSKKVVIFWWIAPGNSTPRIYQHRPNCKAQVVAISETIIAWNRDCWYFGFTTLWSLQKQHDFMASVWFPAGFHLNFPGGGRRRLFARPDAHLHDQLLRRHEVLTNQKQNTAEDAASQCEYW